MWYYKLVTLGGDIYYYDYDELDEARSDKAKYGGIITDKNGRKY